ncbi:MAG TPA: efflux RND transporter periplasmic adaptor subunit, partial [Aquaticitalea sp.]|nr:efflux RND transporter periplasmic adaptor subunit [Aquaticitalea sp.]
QEQESAVLIPESALVRNGQLTGVYVVSEQKTAVLRWLKTGKTIGENIEILSGLKVDEPYITSSDGKLYNGVKIQIK